MNILRSVCLLILLICFSFVSAEEKEKKTVKVKEEAFEASVELEGVIESTSLEEISVRPKSWGELTIREVIPHGTRVKEGDVLIRFETENLEKAIDDEESALPLARLKLEDAATKLDLSRRKLPLELENKRRDKSRSQEDFTYFEEVRRPMEIKSARESLKYYENYLAYSTEELNQLKKMYENDDVTEETEEIVLRRALDSVNRDKWSLEQAKVRTDRSLSKSIPREYENLEHSRELKKIEWEDAIASSERALRLQEMEFAAQKRALTKSEEKLINLKHDQNLMVITAPGDGIVYYGAAKRGKWVTAATVEKKLIPGGRASSGEVLMTVVDPSEVQLRVPVPEEKLKDLKENLSADVTMKWNDTVKLKSKLKSISYVPQSDAKYDTIFSIEKSKVDAPINPGMNAKVKISTYKNDKALVIPKNAVKKEGDKTIVTMKDGSKRTIKTGRSNKEKQVVLEGLKPGEEIELPPAKPTPEKK